jgi:hypothetical protein
MAVKDTAARAAGQAKFSLHAEAGGKVRCKGSRQQLSGLCGKLEADRAKESSLLALCAHSRNMKRSLAVQ